VRLTLHNISSLTQQRKSDATYCSSQLATYKEFVVTTTGTFNDALSTLKIWLFNESRMILDYTSLNHDGKNLSLSTKLQDLNLIAYSTLTVRRCQILGILSIYVVFIFYQPRTSFIDVWRWILQYNSILPVHDWYYAQVY
jgi:hypothetical protein